MKKAVCNSACLWKIPLPSFRSLTETPVMYDRNEGYKGKQHGDTKDRNPAPKASHTVKSAALTPHSPFFHYGT